MLALPTYAAAAWYHRKLPNRPEALVPFLKEVEQFATGEFASALSTGFTLPPERRHAIAETLHNYTGLPVDYLERANLRINVGEFNKTLLGGDLYESGHMVYAREQDLKALHDNVAAFIENTRKGDGG